MSEQGEPRFDPAPVRRPARKRRRVARRRRRLLIALGSLVALVVLLAGGLYGYARWRFDEIPKVAVPGLVPRNGGQPFDVLLVGSDSRAFVDNASEAAKFGSASEASGQRSDVDIVARVAPALGEVELLSIPRDTYVDIPGDVAGISGPNRINAAFNSGPALLVRTIQQVFHIPISDYAEVNFPGFEGMVNAVGGIGLDFADPVKDAYSGLDITHVGCQLVDGTQALALVRSRHLYYEKDGVWEADEGSDWSRIQRQDAFFRALLPKLRTIDTNPAGLNDFLSALTANIAIDNSISESELLSLANTFRHMSSFQSETLPTIPYTTPAGADVLLPASGPDEQMISQFLAFGAQSAHTTAALRPSAHAAVELTAVLLSATVPPVTSVVGESGDSGDVVYNTAPEPWNPTPCHPA